MPFYDKSRKKKIYPFVRKEGDRLKTMYSFYRQHPVFVTAPLVITEVSPVIVRTLGGTIMTITGKGFAFPGYGVLFDNATPAVQLLFVSNTRIVCEVPALSEGFHNVLVHNENGKSNAVQIYSLDNWDPSRLTGGAHWYRSDVGVTVVADKVSQWDDQIGSANLTQASDPVRPAFLASDSDYAGQPSVVASAGAFLANASVTLTQPFTVWYVGEFTVGTFGRFLDFGTPVIYTESDLPAYVKMYAGNIITATGASGAQFKHAFLGMFNSSFSFVAMEKWFDEPFADAGSSNGTSIGVFATKDGFGAIDAGKIVELVIQTGTPTSDEIQRMATYFNTRYGTNVIDIPVVVNSVNTNIVAPGDQFTIFGSGFTGASAVELGSSGIAIKDLATFIVNNDGEIVVTCEDVASMYWNTPLDIIVTRGAKFGTNTNLITVAKPVISSLNPNTGLIAGGESIQINGVGFTSATNVLVDGNGVSYSVFGDTLIQFTTVSHSPGAVNVTVEGPINSDTSFGGFTYTPPAPSITSVFPDNGDNTGGTFVEIFGEGFTDTISVTFGSTFESFTVINDGYIQIASVTNDFAEIGTVTVTISTPIGTAFSNYTFNP